MAGKIMTELKKLRKRIPSFRRQEAHLRKKLSGSGWRRPRGFHSKLRQDHKSKGLRVKVGYRLPRSLRGLTLAGKKVVRVDNVSELRSVDKSTCVIVIGSNVGMKKKLAILKTAKELGYEVENLDLAKYEKKAEAKLADRKAKRKAKKAKKEKKSKKEVKKAEKKPEVKAEEKVEVKKEEKPEVKKEEPKKEKAEEKKEVKKPAKEAKK